MLIQVTWISLKKLGSTEKYIKNFTKSAYLHCSVTNFWRKKYFQQYIFEGKIITSNTFDSRQNPPLQNMSMKPYLQNDSLQTIHTLFIRTYPKNLLGIKISLCSWYAIKLNKPNHPCHVLNKEQQSCLNIPTLLKDINQR